MSVSETKIVDSELGVIHKSLEKEWRNRKSV